MLFFDHLAIGILLNNSFQKKFTYVPLIVVLIASILPDIPVILLGGPGTIEYLAHRKYTHSLLLAPLYSIIPIILCLYFILKSNYKNKFLSLYLLSFAGYLLHIFFDLITPFGTKLFYPLSEEIYSLDILHSFDPIFLTFSTIIIMYFFISSIKRKPISLRINIIFIILYASYMLIALLVKSHFSNTYELYTKNNYKSYSYVRTIPRTFWRWKGIAKNSSEFLVIRTNKGKIEYKTYSLSLRIPEWLKKITIIKNLSTMPVFP